MTVTIFVCGNRYMTTLETLSAKPDTKLATECTEDGKEYFFDRNPEFFTSILDYYRTDELHMPTNACPNAFRNELDFWGIDGTSQMSMCCLERYTGGQYEKYERYFDHSPNSASRVTMFPAPGYKHKLYQLLEDPSSSKYIAKIPACLYTFCVLIILLTVVIDLTFASVDWWGHTTVTENGTHITEPIGSVGSSGADMMFLQLAHLICVCYIVVEFFIRLLCCPMSKFNFLLLPFNILDYAVFPFLLVGVLDSFVEVEYGNYTIIEFMSVLQLLLLIRLLKFFRHCTPVKVLYLTFKSTGTDLILYLFMAFVAVVFFACCVLVCEFKDPHSSFHVSFMSVPGAMWWAAVTMSTVGYGDMTPVTIFGKLVSTICIITGLIFIALIFSAVNSNFSKFLAYGKRHESRRREQLSRGVNSPRDIEGVMLIPNSQETESHS